MTIIVFALGYAAGLLTMFRIRVHLVPQSDPSLIEEEPRERRRRMIIHGPFYDHGNMWFYVFDRVQVDLDMRWREG